VSCKKVKVKLSLCLTKHHAMKAYWGSGGGRGGEEKNSQPLQGLKPYDHPACNPAPCHKAKRLLTSTFSSFKFMWTWLWQHRFTRDCLLSGPLQMKVAEERNWIALIFSHMKWMAWLCLPLILRSGAHPASYPMGTRVSFPGGKAAGAWSWPLTSI
jgi:hypothetical protein